MIFLSPLALWLFLTIPVVIFLHFRENKTGIQANFLKDVQKIYGKWITRKIYELTLKILFFSIIIISLARPTITSQQTEVSKDGIDIVILLDISKSMLAEDMNPSRIEAAKSVISSFTKELTSDRIGIILFAGKPFASVPLTFDYEAVENILSEANTDTINQSVPGLSGTAIGDGILSATDLLTKNAPVDGKRTKTIILLTDGEANVWVDPEITMKYAKEKNVKIYTIGIGKTDGTPLYTTNPQTWEKQYFLDATGNPIIASINEESLKKIATTTGGKYFGASDNDTLKNIFDTLATLEKTKLKTTSTTTNTPLTLYLSGLALILLTIILIERMKVIK